MNGISRLPHSLIEYLNWVTLKILSLHSKMRYCLLVLLMIFSRLETSAQIVYLDSANNHYLKFDSIHQKHQPVYRVCEYYGSILLSKGKTDYWIDVNYLSYMQGSLAGIIQTQWVDTVVTFDLHGDTLNYDLFTKGKKVFEIHYRENKRTKMSVFTPKRIDYEYFSDGSVEKYYKKRKLRTVVLVKDGKRKEYQYKKRMYQAPYYSKEDKTYYYFSVNDLVSAQLKVTCIAVPIGHRQYKVSYVNSKFYDQEINWQIYRRIPFWKNFKLRHLRRWHRFRDRSQNVYIYTESDKRIFEERYDRRGELVYSRKKYLVNNGYSDHKQSISSSLNKHVYRYASDSFRGHIILKRKSYTHVDTFFNNGFIDITNGVCKNNTYKFTTLRNGKLYRRGYTRMYYPYKRPKALYRYDDDGMNLLLADDLHEIMHNETRLCDEDTFYTGHDTVLLINYDNIRLIDTAGEKVLFDSFYTNCNIVKDQLMCAMGVKNEDNKWLIPPTYDMISTVGIINNVLTGYFASVNDYAAIYTMKGKVLIPPTRGLTRTRVYVRPYYTSALDRINFEAYVCNDLTTDSFKLIDIFNRVLYRGAGKYGFFNKEVVIRHKGRMQFPRLNTSEEVRWFKDTMIPLNGNCILVQMLNSTDTVSQYSLLNVDTWQLYPDTFKVFFKSKQYTGIRSNKRQLFFGGHSPFFEDSSGLSIDTFYGWSDYLMFQNKRKYGLSEDGKLLLKPEFDGIQIGNSVLLAFKDSVAFMYDRSGQFIKSLGNMQTYFKYQKGVTDLPMLEYATDDNYGSILEVWENGLCGIMSDKGEMLLPCIYEDINISNGNYGHVNIKEKLSVVTLSKDSVIQKWEIKKGRAVKVEDREPVVFYHTKKFLYYLGFSGRKAIEVRDYIERKYLNLNPSIFYYAIYDNEKDSFRAAVPSRFSQKFRGDKLIGLRDFQLNWIIRFDTFSIVRPEPRFYYIKTKQGKSGVMNKNYQMKVSPQYPYIYYDERLGLLWHSDKKDGLWKIKDLRLDEELPDSFDYPITFDPNEMSKPISKFGYYGILSSRGKVMVPMLYDKISENTHNQPGFLFFKNNQCHTYGSFSGDLVAQPYAQILTKYNNGRHAESYSSEFGLKGETIYNLSGYFAVDSSQKFFMDKIHSVPRNWVNYTTEVQVSNCSSAEMLSRKRIILHVINGLGSIRHIWWHSPTSANAFPEVHPSYIYPTETVKTGKVFNGSNKGTVSDAIYTSEKLEVNDILNKGLTFFVEDYNTLSYRSGNRFLNLCFDSLGMVYKFDLSLIIAPEMKDSFSHFMRNKWLKLESPNLPCIQQEQIFDFLKTGFVLSERNFVFLPDHLRLIVSRSEMLQFMTEEWAKRLGW